MGTSNFYLGRYHYFYAFVFPAALCVYLGLTIFRMHSSTLDNVLLSEGMSISALFPLQACA